MLNRRRFLAACTAAAAILVHPRGAPQCGKSLSGVEDRGTLNVGAPADVTILELREGNFEFLDNYKGTRAGKQRLFLIATVLAGKRTAPRS